MQLCMLSLQTGILPVWCLPSRFHSSFQPHCNVGVGHLFPNWCLVPHSDMTFTTDCVLHQQSAIPNAVGVLSTCKAVGTCRSLRKNTFIYLFVASFCRESYNRLRLVTSTTNSMLLVLTLQEDIGYAHVQFSAEYAAVNASQCKCSLFLTMRLTFFFLGGGVGGNIFYFIF